MFVVLKVTELATALQKYWLPGFVTCPKGLIVIVNVFADPVQPVPLVYVGVTTIVPVIGEVPPLVAVNDILPVLVAGSPMLVFVLVQE